MHTVSYEFFIKPKESARCHQTLSPRVGSGHETNIVPAAALKQKPLRDMTKAEVEEQCLSAYVVIPAALEVAFKEWWQALKSSDVITIR